MGALSEIGTLITQTLLTLFLSAVTLRFLLQIARADFYNPISQAIVKVTDPLLRPLRRVIPCFGGIDLASIALALLIQLFAIMLVCIINGLGIINPAMALLWGAVGVLSLVTNIYFYTLLASIIVSWVAPGSHHPLIRLVSQLVEPIMSPFRRIIPPMGGLDISPIFVFLALEVVRILIRNGAIMIQLPPNLVLGI